MEFYHVYVHIMGIQSHFFKNVTLDDALVNYICPFLNKEVATLRHEMYNMSQWGIVNVFKTDRPIESGWPINSVLHKLDYTGALRKHLWDELQANVTDQIFREAASLIASGDYKTIAMQAAETVGRRECFFICPLDHEEVDHNYEFVIKPLVREYQFEIQRIDEITHTKEITGVILEAIARSTFVIVDLTAERPNCYYELGYAHALRKPAIILAKKGTPRHFDISTYKWNHWESYTDLKPLLRQELEGVVVQISKRNSLVKR